MPKNKIKKASFKKTSKSKKKTKTNIKRLAKNKKKEKELDQVMNVLNDSEDMVDMSSISKVSKNNISVDGETPIKVYKKMAFSFLVLTFLLLSVVFYFSLVFFVKLTITITPKQEQISENTLLNIYDRNKHNEIPVNALKGVVGQVKISKEKTYFVSGSEIIGEEVVGKVKIINNYSKNQPLVATTRLLTADNKLYRIKKTVNVPAGGSVEVDVYADQPGPTMAIGPTKFTIPGLWAGLQDKIYAISNERFVYQKQVKKFVTQNDIDTAIVDMKRELTKKAEKEIGNNYMGYDKVIYNIDDQSFDININVKANDEQKFFVVKAKGLVNVIAFSGDKLKAISKQKLRALIPNSKKLLNFTNNNISFSLNDYNSEDGIAVINVNLEAKIVLKDDANLIDKRKLVSLSENQIKAYLNNFDEIGSYKLEFSPNFIRKSPSLVNKIKIEIKK